MPELYAQAYDLQPKNGRDPATAMSAALESWTRPRWPQGTPWFLLDEPKAMRSADGSIFRWEPFADGTRRLIEFTWRHPHSGNPAVQWSTRVAFAVLPHRIHASIRVANTGPSIGHPGALLTTRPRLLLNLAEQFTLRSGATSVSPQPIFLAEDDFASFVRYELFDPERPYPVALLSPTASDEYVVSPPSFGREFIGIAKTYCARSAASTYALTSELGKRDLSCFHGAMRLYMPGLHRDSDPRHHPLVLPRRLGTGAERLRVAQVLTFLTVNRFEEEPFLAELRDERAIFSEERRTGLVGQLTNAQNAARAGDDYRQLAELFEEQATQLQRELEGVREDLEEAQYKIAALQFALSQRESVGPAATSEPAFLPPADVGDAVEQAQALFADELLFLPTALETANASPYRNPGEVADALAALAKVARRLKKGGLGKKIADVFSEMNVDYGGGLSPSTPKKIRKQYVFRDGDREYACEEKIRVGGGSPDPANSLRIYFTTKERPHGRIVVGHVGRHLDVISTN